MGQSNATPRFLGCAAARRFLSHWRLDTEGVGTGAESLAAALGQSAELITWIPEGSSATEALQANCLRESGAVPNCFGKLCSRRLQ